MTKSKSTNPAYDRLRTWRDLLFLLLFFIYIWWKIDPRLYYQQQGPVFNSSWYFFRDFLGYPGGVSDYLAAFLSQLFYFSWLGALIVTLLAGIVVLITGRLIHIIGTSEQIEQSKPLHILHILPLVLLIGIHSNYEHTLNFSLAFVLALSATLIYLRFRPKTTSIRILFLIGLALILYYIAGGPFLFFAILCLLAELLIYTDLVSSLAVIISALLLPYLASTFVFMVTIKQAYSYLLPLQLTYQPAMMPWLLYLYYPVVLIGIGLRLRWFPDGTVSLLKKLPVLGKAFQKADKAYFRLAIDAVIITALGILIAVLSYNERFNSYLKMNYYAETRQWQELLNTVQKYGIQNEVVTCLVNQALYHRGKLLDEMFSYPQNYGTDGLFLSREYRNVFPIIRSDIFFELGHINEAEHWVREALTLKGENPRNLKRLAQIKLLKGEKEACRKCLRNLERSLLFQRWVDRYYQYLENDSLIADDPQLARIRRLMPNEDFIVIVNQSDFDLEQLLRQNPENRMAFEYLLATHLLNGDIYHLIETFNNYSTYRINEIPRHFDEAMMIYMTESKSEKTPIPGNIFTIQRTLKDFNKMKQILVEYKGDKWRAQKRLQPEFANTYWYYVLYHLGASNE
jgi:hypothetical protein